MEKVEKLLSDLFPDNAPPSKDAYKSFYFQPERIQVSSEQDVNIFISQNALQEEFFNQFQVNLPRPALNVKSLQLVRASIPNAVVNIPDTETIFWYYKIPTAELYTPGFTANRLRMVRLLPSWYKPELNTINEANGGNFYAFNRTFTDYQDLASALVKACTNDPIADNDPTQTLFRSGDISLTYNETLNKFVFKGLLPIVSGVEYSYIVAGYNDPNVLIRAQELQQQSSNYDWFGLNVTPQQFQPKQTLNLRLGFTWDGSNTTLIPSSTSGINIVLFFRIRPIPEFPGLAFATIPYNPDTLEYTAENYANLVNTNTINLYADIVSGSTTDSVRSVNLLASVPVNASNLGVTFYNPVISNPLTKIQDQIYTIRVSMFDDKGLPFNLPNSAVVSLELALTY